MEFNKEARLEHWSTGWTAKNQGDSDPAPFIDYVKYFSDADVLEIGPGQGRAYEVIRRIVKSYTIADISQQALDSIVWADVERRFLIEEWSDHLGRTFDVVHFWYVLHHVPRCELFDFLDFAQKHLPHEGILMFNTPYLGFHEGAYKDDGVQTTRYTVGEITAMLDTFGVRHLYIDGTRIGKSNGHIYVGRKL